MGGGGQANSGQASQAASQQTAANNQDMALSKQYGGQEQQIFNQLFGQGGSGGSLSQFMDPKNLDQKGLNSNYKTQFNEGSNQLAQGYAQQRGALARNFANAGATPNSTPNGFQADQMNKLGRGEADTRGQLYAGLKGQQYSDTLNNFWNANNVAAGQQAQATGGSTAGAGNAGSSSASMYGTAGAYHPSQWGNVLGSALGAAGTVGASAMSGGTASAASQCPASGSLVLLEDGSTKNIEDLRAGDILQSKDGTATVLLKDPTPGKQSVLIVKTEQFSVRVSHSHWFDRPSCGYVLAIESIGKLLPTLNGDQKVLDLAHGGQSLCWDLTLDESHSYNVDGFWSLG